MSHSATLAYHGSFLLIGGDMGGGRQCTSIFKFEAETEEWVPLPGRLGPGSAGATALFVRQDLFPNC